MIEGHGDDIYRYNHIRINFSSNVYGQFDHEDLFCFLADSLDHVANYPEPTPLTLERNLALSMDLEPEQLMVTNGATEAIYLIAQTWKEQRSAVLAPTFSEYADACRIHRHQVTHIYRLSQLNDRYRMVWICNPNNPTGEVIDKEQLSDCITRLADTLFIIDASYERFTNCLLLTPSEAVQQPNVLMLHSMTKNYGLPGLRLGYVTGNARLLNDLRCQRMPWSVNQVAIDAANYLLAHEEAYQLDIEALMAERERVSQRLSELGIVRVWPSDSHMLLCKLSIGKASALKDFLAQEKGLLIRDASNFEGLDETYFRMAVQTAEADDELINGINQWMEL